MEKCVISSFLSFHGIIKLDVFRCFGATYFSLKKTNVNAYLKKDSVSIFHCKFKFLNM